MFGGKRAKESRTYLAWQKFHAPDFYFDNAFIDDRYAGARGLA